MVGVTQKHSWYARPRTSANVNLNRGMRLVVEERIHYSYPPGRNRICESLRVGEAGRIPEAPQLTLSSQGIARGRR